MLHYCNKNRILLFFIKESVKSTILVSNSYIVNVLTTKGKTMLNNLKTTTALVGALSIAATAAVAETKVSGNIEQTFATVSQDLAANEVDGKRGFGTESNIGLSASKDLDNGMTAKYGFILEADSTAKSDTKYLTLGSGNFSTTIGEDTGHNLNSGTVIPFVSDNFETIGGSTGGGLNFDSHGSSLNPHESAHISFDFKFDGGTATYRYAPNNTNKAGDSTISDGSSQTEYLVSGKFNGIGYIAGKMIGAETNSDDAGDEGDYRVLGLSYTYNNITFGVEERDTDTGSTAAGSEFDARQYGIAAAINDNTSIGVYMLKNEKDATSTEEEAKMIQLGYNLGGLGVQVSYMQIEDAAFAAGADADVVQIKTTQKF